MSASGLQKAVKMLVITQGFTVLLPKNELQKQNHTTLTDQQSDS